MLASWRTEGPEASPVRAEHVRDVKRLGGCHEARVREVHRQLGVLVHQRVRPAMSRCVEADDGNVGRQQEFERFARGRATAQYEVACFRDDGFDRYAAVDERRPVFGTSRMPLVARIEHGDERSRVEQDIARLRHDNETLIAPVVGAQLLGKRVALDCRRVERD